MQWFLYSLCENILLLGSRYLRTTSAYEELLAVKMIISAKLDSYYKNYLQWGLTLIPADIIIPPSTGKSNLVV